MSGALMTGNGKWLIDKSDRLFLKDDQRITETESIYRINLATRPIPTTVNGSWASNNATQFTHKLSKDSTAPGGWSVLSTVVAVTVPYDYLASSYGVGHVWANTGVGVVPIVVSKTYTASVYVKVHSSQVLSFRATLTVVIYNTSGTSVQTVNGTATPVDKTGWTRVSATITATTTGTLRTSLAVRTNPTGGDVVRGPGAYFAGAMIEETSRVQPWFGSIDLDPLHDMRLMDLSNINAAASENFGPVISVRRKLALGGLVANGFGENGNTYNWPGTTYVAGDVPSGIGASGSFRYTGIKTNFTTEPLFLDWNASYDMSVWVKADNATNGVYLGFGSYDADGCVVSPAYVLRNAGAADTTLAVALNVGDTTVTLTSATGWQNAGADHQRHFVWWPYTSIAGITYADYTYSRNDTNQLTGYSAAAWTAGGISGNVITLAAAWPGPALAAGTKVSNRNSGSTYNYPMSQGSAAPTTWTQRTTTVSGTALRGAYAEAKFRQGTYCIRPMVYTYTAGVTYWWTGFRIAKTGS